MSMKVLRDLRNSREPIIHTNLGYAIRTSFYCYDVADIVKGRSSGDNRPPPTDSVYWVYEDIMAVDVDTALKAVIQECDEVLALKTLVNLKITRDMEAVAKKNVGELGVEAQTWQLQKTELEAYRANSKAHTPFCDSIAEARGISKSDLMDKIEKKSNAYVLGVGGIIGMKQKLEDMITNANDVETLRGISWDLL